jgi:hypothetical protein
MKLFKVSRLILLFCCACVAAKPGTQAISADSIEKTYYVKGMTCGGCVFHVEKAIEKDANKINFIKKKIEVGNLSLFFKKDGYKGKNTDCAVQNSIEGQTDYKLFLDKGLKTPAC